MKREDFLRAFAELPPENQEAIRIILSGQGVPRETWVPMAMCHEMVAKMMASKDPMDMCRRILEDPDWGGDPKELCTDMMERMQAGGDAMAVCHEMMQKIAGQCACS